MQRRRQRLAAHSSTSRGGPDRARARHCTRTGTRSRARTGRRLADLPTRPRDPFSEAYLISPVAERAEENEHKGVTAARPALPLHTKPATTYRRHDDERDCSQSDANAVECEPRNETRAVFDGRVVDAPD